MPTAHHVRGCYDAEDSFTLFVRRNGVLLTAQDYCSAYSHSEVQVIDDAKGVSYLILRYGNGHGTSAVSTHIAVLRVGNGLALCARQLIEQAAGPSSVWEYKYKTERPDGGGLRLRFEREITGSDPEDFPQAKTKVIDIDTRGRPCRGRDLKHQKLTGDGCRTYPEGDDNYEAAKPSHPLRRLDPQKH